MKELASNGGRAFPSLLLTKLKASVLQVKVLYVKGLPESATDEKLRELFVKYGEIERAVIPPPKPGQPPRNFGFVHFADRKAALAAMEKDQKHELEGEGFLCSIFVRWMLQSRFVEMKRNRRHG